MFEQTDVDDIVIVCEDCSQPFTWTAGEQSFYAERGFAKPRRCATCRRARKQSKEIESRTPRG
jgi:hypothetical protein